MNPKWKELDMALTILFVVLSLAAVHAQGGVGGSYQTSSRHIRGGTNIKLDNLKDPPFYVFSSFFTVQTN